MNDAYSMGEILWSSDSATLRAIWIVLSLALVSALTVYLPLIIRVWRLFRVERKLRDLADEISPTKSTAKLDDFKAMLVASPIQSHYEEFERRWNTAQLTEQAGRAPVRLVDVFDERPLLPFGPRRSLLPVLPGLLLASGAFAAISGFIPSLSATAGAADAESAWMATHLGLAMRAAAWGFICSIGASLTGRLIEGAFDARTHGLDEVVESAFASISPGELAEITRRTQQTSLETLGRELTEFANELNERLDRGLQRIEQSTARSANLVSQEQRGALHTIVGELSLSVRQGVEHHLGELRSALQRAVEHQNTVVGGLAQTFQSMAENSKIQDRVARTLDTSARSVEEAARAMQTSTSEMHPVLEHLGTTSEALSNTAERISDTQLVVARTAEGVRSSLEHAATGVNDQRQFIELSLSEIRKTLVGLGDGLGDSVQRSLREVDEVLAKTVTTFRDTLAESNDTIDRLSSPIRAVEGSSREIHLALDRVRGEIEVLGQWMNQAAKPLRSGLADVDGRAEEIGRTMTEFNNHARQIDKTMEALRHEIHQESRRIQGAGSELGRRLQQTSDAVGFLETSTSDTARRARPQEGDPVRPPRERQWAAAPPTRDTADRVERGRDREAAFAPESPRDARTTHPTVETPDMGLSDSESSREYAGSTAGTNYRVGAPKAQGPDPYKRFDRDEEEPSNLRHFPTPDRDLGQDLKLSGLLGPRSSDEPNQASEDDTQTDIKDLVDDDAPPSGKRK